MHESSNRRTTIARISAALAAGTGGRLPAIAGAASEPETERRKHRSQVNLDVGGALAGVTYSPVHGDDDTHWTIRGRQQGDATVHHMKSGKRDRMSGAALHRLMMKKTGGRNMQGMPQFSVGGINWRINDAKFDHQSAEWTLDACVCDAHPDARPNVAQRREAAVSRLDPVEGCNCRGCNSKRYQHEAVRPKLLRRLKWVLVIAFPCAPQPGDSLPERFRDRGAAPVRKTYLTGGFRGETPGNWRTAYETAITPTR